jgi:hypothetical protein
MRVDLVLDVLQHPCTMESFIPGFAILRIDLDYEAHEDRLTVRRVVWDQALAEAEVQRLNDLNAGKDCRYFWQYTRVDAPPPRKCG